MSVEPGMFIFPSRALSIKDVKGLDEGEEGWVSSIRLFVESWYDGSESLVATTSGTTSKGKTIRLSKSSMKMSADRTNDYFHVTPTSRLLLCLPVDYIAGKMMIVRALQSGADLECLQPSLTPSSECTEPIGFAAMTPAQLSGLMHNAAGMKLLRRISALLLGGGPMPLHLESAVDSLSTKVYQGFGMTETCSHIALRAVNGPDASDIYQVVQDVSLGVDSHDCLRISGQLVLDGDFLTRDQVELLGHDAFRWLGRHDNMINSGGLKLHPEQVEPEIRHHLPDDFPDFFLGGLHDDQLGQRPVLVMAMDDICDQNTDALLKAAALAMSGPAAPKEVRGVSEMLYTTNRKLRRESTLSQLNEVQ